MFNHSLMTPDTRLNNAGTVSPSDVVLYLPLTTDLSDQGYYGLTGVQYQTSDTVGQSTTPAPVGGWMRFGYTGGARSTPKGTDTRSGAIVYNHPSFNDLCLDSTKDFTIEFNVKIAGDNQSGTYGNALKVFPFSLVGAASQQVVTTVPTSLGGPGTVVWPQGGAVEMGMTIGSHQAPGGLGFGVGTADGTNIGYAAACTNNDAAPDSFVNRGIAPIPAGNASMWGPYYIAVVRKNGVVSIFINGKKVNSPAYADEDGTADPAAIHPTSTWNWNTFKFDNTVPVANGYFNGNTGSGLFVGGSLTYSAYGADDDLYLQHFRITRNVARYDSDFVPEPIYTV